MTRDLVLSTTFFLIKTDGTEVQQVPFFFKFSDSAITKMYEILLKFEEEEVKECMVKWAKNFGHDIHIEHWECMWAKGLKFNLSSNLKESFYKMMYCWYVVREFVWNV